MKRFVFRLDSVRRLREQEEQAVQVELARALRERAAIETQINESRAAENDLYEYLRDPARTAAEMAHVAQYGTLHRERIFNLGVKLRQFDQGVQLIRSRLTKARAKREALDRLREQEHEKWRLEYLKVEQEELDEIATMRANRGLLGGAA